MEIGVSTASLFMRQYNEDALVTLANLDARVCEVFLQGFSEYRPKYGELLKSKSGSLKVHSVHAVTMTYETELFTVNHRQYEDVKSIFKDVLSIMKTLGANCYTMHGRARIKANGDYDNYEKAGKRLAELGEIASEYGVEICLENVPWAFYNKVGFWKEVKKYAPMLKGTLDIKQARLSGYDYSEYLDEMGEDIRTVHLSDVDDNGKIRLPTKGVFDYETLFKKLKDVGFDGNALIEVYKGDYDDVSEIKQSLERLREIKYKIFD